MARTGVLVATAAGAAVIWLTIEAMVAPDFESSHAGAVTYALVAVSFYLVVGMALLAGPLVIGAVVVGRARERALAEEEARLFARPHCVKCRYPVSVRPNGDDAGCLCPECGTRVHPLVARRARELERARAAGEKPGPAPATGLRPGSFLKFVRRWS